MARYYVVPDLGTPPAGASSTAATLTRKAKSWADRRPPDG